MQESPLPGGFRVSGPGGTVPPLWDGHAAEWIADILPRTYFVQSPTRCATSSSFDD
jgi:hypothetical protein